MSDVRKDDDEVVGFAADGAGNLYAAMRSGRVWTLYDGANSWLELMPTIPGTEAHRVELAARSEATDG